MKLRYRIQIETKYTIFFLRKDYYCTDDLLRALDLVDFSKYGVCIVRACAMSNEACFSRSEPLSLPDHTSISKHNRVA